MATRTFRLSIASPSQRIFSGEVTEVHALGVSGALQILAGHEALITPLVAGTIAYTPNGGERRTLTVSGGVLEVSNNQCSILL